MNFDPLSVGVLVAATSVALAAVSTVLYYVIKNRMKNGSQTRSVKPSKDQERLEIKEIKQEDGSLVIKVSLNKSAVSLFGNE